MSELPLEQKDRRIDTFGTEFRQFLDKRCRDLSREAIGIRIKDRGEVGMPSVPHIKVKSPLRLATRLTPSDMHSFHNIITL